MSKKQQEDKDEGIITHLMELQKRLGLILLAVTVGTVIGWIIFPYAYQILAGQLLAIVKEHNGQVFTLQPGEAFFTQGKLAIVIGLILGSPVIIWQLWSFIKPGLLPEERRAIAPIVPAISFLFIMGSYMGHLILPTITRFFLSFTPAGVMANIDYQNSLNFPLKWILTFGLAFQLPVVLIGLIAFRLLTPKILLQQWRYAVVGIAVLAAVIAPEPFSMMLTMVPLLSLYLLTVTFAFWIEKRRKKAEIVDEEEVVDAE
ncbi:MAG: twin-arginine translocase subunit TatC [bacterium]